MRRVIIDTDPGVDDALAILLAAASPELKLEAITVVAGNVGLDAGLRNTLLTLDAVDMVAPPLVARGAAKHLERDCVHATHVHGEDGLGGVAAELGDPRTAAVDLDAVEVILDTVSINPGEISLIALGPLTNLARAFLLDAGAMTLVRDVIIMGGALRVPGNVTPSAEFNFYADPEAAHIVLSSGVPITVVGLDVTMQTRVSREEFTRRAQASSRPWAGFAERICRGYFDQRERQTGRAECILHDPLAIGVALDPPLVVTERHRLDVETEGIATTGMLVADLREERPPSSARQDPDVAVEVDADRFRAHFLDRLFG